MTKLSDLINKKMISVKNNRNRELVFTTNDKRIFKLYHRQECCEDVSIDDIVGNLKHLVGEPILMAEKVSNVEQPPLNKNENSYTWTFYKFATIKGYVTIKWYGTSSGYYSEKVNFNEFDKHGKIIYRKKTLT